MCGDWKKRVGKCFRTSKKTVTRLLCVIRNVSTVLRVENPAVGPDEFARAETLVPVELKKAITAAKANIEAFHKLQMPAVVEYTSPAGFTCRQEPRPIEKVGLYIPGGSAPLFSTVLMLAVPGGDSRMP